MRQLGMMGRLAAIFVFVILAVQNSLAVCPYTECNCDDDDINCQSLKLTDVPTLQPTTDSFTRLKIYDNQIEEVEDNSLPPNLSEIDFSHNPISDISPTAFSGSADTLTTLTFNNAQFTELPEALLALNSLQSLTIMNTDITYWDENVLKHLAPTLTTLVLKSVGLTSWPTWVQYLPNLTTLKLSNDPLTIIPDDALNPHEERMSTLVISNANLTTVPTTTSTMTELQTLDLTYNNIEDLEYLPKSSKLSNLYLGSNKISDVEKLVDGLTPFANSLNYLYLNDNKLTSVPQIYHMSELIVVNLKRNQITDATAAGFAASVQTVDLSENLLTEIPDVFMHMPGLRYLLLDDNQIQRVHASVVPAHITLLDLGGNQLKEVGDESFPLNSQLKTLNLDRNPIETVGPSAFDQLSLLESLNLEGAPLKRMPLALSSLTNLKTLNMMHVQVICTCGESQLYSWFQSRPNMTIENTGCGELTIAEFYNEVAPQCPEVAGNAK